MGAAPVAELYLEAVVHLVQERNLKHTSGGPEASRLTATARKKLTGLGLAVDALRDQLEARELINV